MQNWAVPRLAAALRLLGAALSLDLGVGQDELDAVLDTESPKDALISL
eukprot:COSAG04_NODE_15580_length_527_cov_1.007009_1_plen_47_part_01